MTDSSRIPLEISSGLINEKRDSKRLSTASMSTVADEKSSNDIKSVLISIFEGGSVLGATFTLIAATIGTGIVMISDSLAPSGTLWSSIQMAFCVWLSYFTLVTLVRCANDLNAQTYQELAQMTYGNWFRHLVNFCIFFANWGSAILYFQLGTELIAVVCNSFDATTLPAWLTETDSKIITLLQATLFVFPLCCARELKALRYFCFVNFLLILFICYVVIYEGIVYEPLKQGFKATTLIIINGFATTFPSAVFMMTPHPNVIDVFRELNQSTMKNIRTVITWTVLFSLVVYLSVGLIGYATFADNLNILEGQNYANSLILVGYGWKLSGVQQAYTAVIVVCMIGMIASIIISQPFNLKPAKDSLRDSIKFILKNYGYLPPETDENAETTLERIIYTFVTLYTCVLVVLYFDGAQMVVNIVGSSFTTMFCFIFPSLFYVKIHKYELPMKEKILHGSVIVVCSILAAWTTIDNILDLV